MKRFLVLFFLIFFPVSVLAGFNVTTLADLEQDVKNNLAIEADPYHPDSVLDDFINMACRDVASHWVIIKADSIIVVTDSTHYDLNDDFLEALAVFPCTVRASRGLDRINFRDWGKIAASTQLTDKQYYAIQPKNIELGAEKKGKLWLYPIPASTDTLVVIYIAEARTLSTDTNTTNIPWEFRQFVVMYATALAFARAQSYDKAAWWLALYDQMLTKALARRVYLPDYIIQPKQIGK